MQGRTKSSESIWTAFNSMTTAVVRHIKYAFRVAWTRSEKSSAYAVVGSSIVNGNDLVKGLIASVTPLDVFEYFDETEDLLSLEYDRQIQEPLGGLAMAILDASLSNIDHRYSPNVNSTIGTAILPNRPTRASIGFRLLSTDQLVTIFKGLTMMPKENKMSRTSDVQAYDYVKFLNDYPLESEIYVNQRSDQIIQDILTTVGIGSSSYALDTGRNTIGFAWFDKNAKAGDRIKKICEAEDAIFFQDENGILRFENRNHYGMSPYTHPVWDIEPSHIMNWREDNNTKIINDITVTANPREVVTNTVEIWKNGIEEEIEIGESIEIWAQMDNPIYELTTPAQDIDYKAYTGANATGTDISSDIDVDADLLTTTIKLTITNNSGSKAYLSLMRLRGKPALITSEIKVRVIDNGSVDKYGTQPFTLDNDFIDSQDFAEYIANALVTKYSEPTRRIVLTVQGVPQLQLRDMVRVKDPDINAYKDFRVMRIQGKLDGGSFVQDLYLREVVAGEYDNYAIVGQSVVEGSDLVSP